MVRLMIEEMGKGRRNALADRAHVSYRGVGETSGDIVTVQSIDPVDEAGIFCIRAVCSSSRFSKRMMSSAWARRLRR